MTATKVEKMNELKGTIQILSNKHNFCYFENTKLCTRKCIHFDTCLRNPYRERGIKYVK